MQRQLCWLTSAIGIILLVAFFSLILFLGAAQADGTEELGPPQGITIAQGSGLIAAGVGISDTIPASLVISVPRNSTIKQVLLYWSGGMTDTT